MREMELLPSICNHEIGDLLKFLCYGGLRLNGEQESGIIRLFASLVKVFSRTLHITRGTKPSTIFIAGKVTLIKIDRL